MPSPPKRVPQPLSAAAREKIDPASDNPKRLQRLETLRAAVQKGEYRVDSKQLAEALIKHHLAR